MIGIENIYEFHEHIIEYMSDVLKYITYYYNTTYLTELKLDILNRLHFLL